MYKEINALGLICPMPLLKLKLALKECEVKQVLKIRVSDNASIRDIPAWAIKQNHHVVVERLSAAETVICITK